VSHSAGHAIPDPQSRAVATAPSMARVLLLSTALVVLYVGVGAWGFVFTPDALGIPLVWPATGVGLVFVFLYGYRLLPAVAVGAGLIAILFTGDMAPPLERVVSVAATVVATALGAGLLRRWRFDPRLAHLRDLGVFLVAGGGVSSGLNAVVGAYGVAAGSEQASFAGTWWVCWAADLMGLALIAPLLFALLGGRFLLPPGHDYRVGGALIIGIIATSVVVYLVPLSLAVALPLSYLAFPLIMFAALQCPVQITTGLIGLSGALALTATGLGYGPFAALGLEHSLLALNAQLGLLVITGLSLTAIRSEREAAESRARDHLESLARAGRINLMGQLSATLAHELNQPLCALTTYAQAGRRLLQRGEPEAAADALERLEDNARRASETVRQIRTFASREAPDRQSCSPAELVRNAEALMRRELGQRGVALQVNVAPELPPVEVAPIQVEQVLVNLLRNAGEVLAGRPDARVRLSVYRRRQELVLQVSDNGPGIPPEHLSRLFEPFTSFKRGGMGIGLALCRSIIESHGGAFTARNGNAGGAEFRFTLPLEASHGHAQTDRSSGG